MSDASENHSAGDDSEYASDSQVESGSEGSRKSPAHTTWEFSGTFAVKCPDDDQPALSAEEVTSQSAVYFQAMFLDRAEAKQYLGPRFVHYMLALFDRSSVHRPASYEDKFHVYLIPIRGYLECKRTTVRKLFGWMQQDLFRDVKWSAIPSQLPAHQPYLNDMSEIENAHSPWGKFFSAGRNSSPALRGKVWAFTGKLKCELGDDLDGVERIAKIKDIFRAKYMSDDSHERQRPHQVKNVLILCDALNVMKSNGSTTFMELRGYIQSKSARLSLWKAWLPPDDFEWRRVQGPLNRDSQFLADTSELRPSADAGSSNRAASPWILLLSEGKGDMLKSPRSASSSRSAKKVSRNTLLLHRR